MQTHRDITRERVFTAVERSHTSLDNPGFCTRCGAEADGVEPDAIAYECEQCGENGVYGAKELLIHLC